MYKSKSPVNAPAFDEDNNGKSDVSPDQKKRRSRTVAIRSDDETAFRVVIPNEQHSVINAISKASGLSIDTLATIAFTLLIDSEPEALNEHIQKALATKATNAMAALLKRKNGNA